MLRRRNGKILPHVPLDICDNFSRRIQPRWVAICGQLGVDAIGGKSYLHICRHYGLDAFFNSIEVKIRECWQQWNENKQHNLTSHGKQIEAGFSKCDRTLCCKSLFYIIIPTPICLSIWGYTKEISISANTSTNYTKLFNKNISTRPITIPGTCLGQILNSSDPLHRPHS